MHVNIDVYKLRIYKEILDTAYSKGGGGGVSSK